MDVPKNPIGQLHSPGRTHCPPFRQAGLHIAGGKEEGRKRERGRGREEGGRKRERGRRKGKDQVGEVERQRGRKRGRRRGRWRGEEKGEEGGGEGGGEKQEKEVGENLIACRTNYDTTLSHWQYTSYQLTHALSVCIHLIPIGTDALETSWQVDAMAVGRTVVTNRV